jgi:hypothetical protein
MNRLARSGSTGFRVRPVALVAEENRVEAGPDEDLDVSTNRLDTEGVGEYAGTVTPPNLFRGPAPTEI